MLIKKYFQLISNYNVQNVKKKFNTIKLKRNKANFTQIYKQ